MAMVFNTSVRRESAIKKQASVNEKIEMLNTLDLTVYWIGGFPSELEKLRQKTNVIMPENISKDNMPVKSSSFHITVKDDSGKTHEIVPRKYTEFMLIVVTTGEGFSDEAKDILRDCIAYNGVPVLCIGKEACEMMGTLLIHGSGFGRDHSFYYKRNEGYKDPYFDAKTVSSGGVELAEKFCSRLCEYCNVSASTRQSEASQIIASAKISSSEAAITSQAQGSETEPSETTGRIMFPIPPS